MAFARGLLPDGKCFVGALYHPPKTQSYKEEDLVACIVDSVDEIMTAFPSALIILAGDLNQLSDKVIAERTGLESIVIQPTRGTAFLDRVYVSMPCYDNVQVITSIIKSDHKAILASSSENKLLGKKQSWTAKYRKMGPSQNAAFLGCMKDYKFVVDEHSSVQEEFDGFYESMITLMNNFFPEKTITMTDKDPDYITPAIKAKLRLKNKLLRQGKMEQANVLSGRIGHIIAKKNSSEFSHLNERSTSKDLWNAVKRIKSRSRHDGLKLVEGLDAEIMNQHYQTISTDVAYIVPRYKQTVATGNTDTFTETHIY